LKPWSQQGSARFGKRGLDKNVIVRTLSIKPA
jgi:hypothetical protein